jgi:hypothetical protein
MFQLVASGAPDRCREYENKNGGDPCNGAIVHLQGVYDPPKEINHQRNPWIPIAFLIALLMAPVSGGLALWSLRHL